MNKTLKKLVLNELCPNGKWKLTDSVKSGLRRQLSRLPRQRVSENDTRYPESPASMRAFLVKFFTRHYLQSQNCLTDYMTSQDFLDVVKEGHLRILDIGSGPAVTSLAITDILACMLEHIRVKGAWPRHKTVKVDIILNDTSGICLGTGQQMLADYFRSPKRLHSGVTHGNTISIQKAFPDNMKQLQRIKLNLGNYDIASLSYVVSPLKENESLRELSDRLLNIERLCHPHGRILILQDRFQAATMRQLSKLLGTSAEEEVSTQEIYPRRYDNETYTYSYYRCLYSPMDKKMRACSSVA